MASTFLDGISVSNFRGIGDEQRLGPFKPMNFFIGPNNAGKSTALALIARYLHHQKGPDRPQLWERRWDPLDVRLGKNQAEIQFGIGVELERAIQLAKTGTPANVHGLVERLLSGLAEGGILWLRPREDRRALEFKNKADAKALAGFRDIDWNTFWRQLTGGSGGNVDSTWVPNSTAIVAEKIQINFPGVVLIPAIREVGPANADESDYSGRGLIDQLAEFQGPPHDQQQKKQVFNKINEFLQIVTGVADARIEIPYDKRHVLVHMDGRVLPLSALGTGIHEVVMIAAFCTMHQKQIICVEEPEIHLHPLLQRRLIEYLFSATGNQYFIATHSASLIDSCPAAIFDVSNRDGETHVSLVQSPADRHEILRELGYRASDLLQSNAIIWVEGPSDRIYLNHWISSVASELCEGIDYSIMFYGGRLLAHLSAADQDVSDFISLCRLNRNVAVLIDSDKRTANSPINATKLRIKSEIGRGRVWITNGKEIENYVSEASVVSAADTLLNVSGASLTNQGKYASRTEVRIPNGKSVQLDKLKLARELAKWPADLSQLDLRKQIIELVKFIKGAVR